MAWGEDARRLDALEREVAEMRAELAGAREQMATLRHQADLEAERARAASAMGTLGSQLAALSDQAERAAAAGAAVSALAERVAALEEQGAELAPLAVGLQQAADGQGKELALLRSSLLSLERQMRSQDEDLGRALSALVLEASAARRSAPLA